VSKTPYIGFGNDTLDQQPSVKRGDLIICPICENRHKLEGTESEDGVKDLILFYKCGEKLRLGAVDGKLVANLKVDCSGEIEL